MAKKRAFVRYSKQGKIVPGSLILTAGSFPQGSSTWKEVPADLCCAIHPISFNLTNGKTQNADIPLYPASEFPWNTDYIYLQLGCSVTDPNAIEWSIFYIPGSPATLIELCNILNKKASYLGTFEIANDSVTLILNTNVEIAQLMCPDYLQNNLVFSVNNN